MTDQQPQQFYAATAFNWATAETRAAAIAKVARDVGADQIKTQVKNNGGLYVWSCRVRAPAGADYEIKFFKPQGVETDRGREHMIQNVKGHVLAED